MTLTETTTTTTTNTTPTERKQRRRSTLEESNRSKAGVLEWIGWTRDNSARQLGGPKPVKRESIHANVHQEWISGDDSNGHVNGHATEKNLDSNSSSSSKEPQRGATKTHSDNWEDVHATGKDVPNGNNNPTNRSVTNNGIGNINDSSESWFSKYRYGLIVAGAVLVVAIGVNMTFSKEKTTSGQHS